jgi:hypothetical protein
MGRSSSAVSPERRSRTRHRFPTYALYPHMHGLCAVTRRRLHRGAPRRDRQGISFGRRRIDEIGSVALFFASDATSLLAGSIMSADGDYSCW